MTVRGLFYRLVGAGVVEKTKDGYRGVVRLASEMRLEGRLPFDWIADNTRIRLGSAAFWSMEDWLKESMRSFRLDLWKNQDAYVEVWAEKDAIAGLLRRVCDPLCVDVLPCRGFPSITFLQSAASWLRAIGKPAFLYYLGDYDPSGVEIPKVIERRLRGFAPGVEISFERLAVHPGQILRWGLPTRPTTESDSRSRGFKGDSVEVDSVPTATLRELVTSAIEEHLDPSKLAAIRREEAAAKETLASIRLPGWGDAA